MSTESDRVSEVEAGIRRVLAPNAGPMTHLGTNTYLVGLRDVMIIDPGPLIDEHISLIQKATVGAHISHILITHAHLDHSQSARHLSEETGAPIIAYGEATAGRRDIMTELAKTGEIGGGEGVDFDFQPHREVSQDDVIRNSEVELITHHIPGHFSGHLGFELVDTMFCGDHVMDWSTSIVSPPDGHVGDFLNSCRHLISRKPKSCLSGHGEKLLDPVGRLEWLIAHRMERERQILDVLNEKPINLEDLVARVYADVPQSLYPAASRNLLAHLIDLWERDIVAVSPKPSLDAKFTLTYV